MAESRFLSRPFRTRQSYLFNLMEPWKRDHQDAMFALDVEESVRVCLTVPNLVQGYLKRLWDVAFRNQIQDFERAREDTLDNFRITAEMFESVRDSIRIAEAKGHVISGAEKLNGAEAEVLRLKEEFVARWPTINETLIERADAAIQKGETESVEDILGELQGTDSETHQG